MKQEFCSAKSRCLFLFIHPQQALASLNFAYKTNSVPSTTLLHVKQGNAEPSAAWITFHLGHPKVVFSVPRPNT